MSHRWVHHSAAACNDTRWHPGASLPRIADPLRRTAPTKTRAACPTAAGAPHVAQAGRRRSARRALARPCHPRSVLLRVAVTRRWDVTTIGVPRHRLVNNRDPRMTPGRADWPHGVRLSPHSVQGARPRDEAAGVRDLRGADKGADAEGDARLWGGGVALPGPRRHRLPDAAKRAGLRADAVRDLAGQRVPDLSQKPRPARPPRQPPGPAEAAATGKLRLARAAPPGRIRLRRGPPSPETWPTPSTPPTPPVQPIHPAGAPSNAGQHSAAGSPADRPSAPRSAPPAARRRSRSHTRPPAPHRACCRPAA